MNGMVLMCLGVAYLEAVMLGAAMGHESRIGRPAGSLVFGILATASLALASLFWDAT